MMNGAQQQSNVTQLNTLGDINEVLARSGFPRVSPEQMDVFKTLENRGRIQRAISLLPNDAGAHRFISELFGRAGIDLKQAHAEQQQQQHRAQPNPSNTDYRAASQGEAPRQPARQTPSNVGTGTGTGTGTGQEPAPTRHQLHIYGQKAALCIEADSTRKEFHTFALEGAASTGPRVYDWQNKTRIQITRAELPTVAAVLVGAMQRCEFKNHGPEKNKGFSIERQNGNKLFVKVFAAGGPLVAVPVAAADVFYMTSIVLRQLQLNMPWMDMVSVTNMLFATHGSQS